MDMSNKLCYLLPNHRKISFSSNDWSLNCLLVCFYCQNCFLLVKHLHDLKHRWGYLSPHFFTISFFFIATCNYKVEGTERKNCPERGKFIIKHEGIFTVFRIGGFLVWFGFKRNVTATLLFQWTSQGNIFISKIADSSKSICTSFWSCKNFCGGKLLCRIISISTALVISDK